MASKQRIIVSGLAGLQPVGGMAWHYFQYVIGLSRLGHEVYYHEDTWTWPYDPVKNCNTDSGEYSANFISGFFDTYAPELANNWHYLHLHEKSYGMSRDAFDKVAASADIFLNISGANFMPDGLSGKCVKAFVDTDPGYNQVLLSERFAWSEFVDRWCDQVAEHDVHFTFGENIPAPGSIVPKLGYKWIPTRMPVVLDLWPVVNSEARKSDWTTVMSWNVFKGKVEYEGIEYGDKSREFANIMNLPAKTGIDATVALGGGKAPVDELLENGWQVTDAPGVTRTAEDYQQFIASSRAEISIAKNIYVAMKTGWFSDRSTCYLASGKPVVLQDTGFSKVLPVGLGLMSFNSADEAVDAVNTIEADYVQHARAAREIAREYFESGVVLSKLLDGI